MKTSVALRTSNHRIRSLNLPGRKAVFKYIMAMSLILISPAVIAAESALTPTTTLPASGKAKNSLIEHPADMSTNSAKPASQSAGDPGSPVGQLIGYARSATIEGQCRWPAVFGRTLQEFAEANVSANNAVTGLSCSTNCPNPDELVSINADNNTYTVRSLCGGAQYVHAAPPIYSLKTTFHDCPNFGDPCNIPSGASIQVEVDYQASGLTLKREYNSRLPSSLAGILGTGWRLSYESSATNYGGMTSASDVHANGSVAFFRPAGQVITFKYDAGSQSWAADADITARVQERDDASGNFLGWSLYPDVSALREDYDRGGRLTVIDRGGGDVVSLQYTSASQLLSAADGMGRTIQFHFSSVAGVQQLDSATLPNGLKLTYSYNSDGTLKSVTYPVDTDGVAHSRLYSYTAGLLTGLVDELGVQTSSWTFASDGSVSSNIRGPVSTPLSVFSVLYNDDGSATVTSPLGHVAQLSAQIVLGARHITGADAYCEDCGSAFQSSNYDDQGRLTDQTDFLGAKTTYAYDASGMETQRVDALGSTQQRTTNTAWNSFYKVPESRTILDGNGDVVSKDELTYNTRGQVTSECNIDPLSPTASAYSCGSSSSAPVGVRQSIYTYCDAVDTLQCPLVGLVRTVDGPRTDVSDIVHYSYYLSTDESGCGTAGGACHRIGDLYQVTDALGHITTMVAYDKNGRLARSQDSNNVITDRTYTPRGWLKTRTVGGATTTIDYDAVGNVIKITDADGVFVGYTYDAAHRLTDITDALGNHIHYTLDAAGNKTKEDTYDSGNTLRRTLSRSYNTLGQLTGITDGLNHTVFNASYTDSYDANGNLVHTADGLGIQRKQGYDALNRLVSTLDNYNGTDTATQNTQATFAYDALDHLEGVTDPGGLSTTYDYDGLSNPKALHSPDTGTTGFQVDAAGNRIQRTDAKGVVRTTTYDALNRPVTVSYPDSTQNITYHYDEADSVTGCSGSFPAGRLTRIVETAVTTTYCYDNHGNVTKKTQAQGSQDDITSYIYTAADRLSTLTTPSQTVTQYSRDAAGRISGVTVTTNGSADQTVVSAITYLPFGPISSYALGNGQTITRSYDANYQLTDLTSPALNLHFTRDVMGNITALGNSPGANPAVEAYGYDPLYRLAGVNDASGNAIEAYTYSKTGDRLSKVKAGGLATGAYGYQSGTHWLTSIGSAARSYDTNGNTTGSSSAGETLGYGYNDRNRLMVVQRNQQTVATYIYNTMGERVAKAVTSPQVVSERFAYNEASQLVGEYGTTNRDYIWLGKLPVAVVDNGTATTISYVHADGLGTPRAISDAAGNTIWQWAYQSNPFGEQQPTGSYVYNLRFPGQYYDVESGLQYNLNRDFDATTGRYEQNDPVGLNGGINAYAYVESTPLSGTDPLGLKMGWAECKKLRDNIYRKHGLLSHEFDKFDPIADAQGGFPMKYGSGVTAPNGHRQEMEDLQRGIKNDLEKYNSECNDDDDNNPPITRNVDALANKPIPCPPQPQPGVPLIALPPVVPAAEAASEAEGLLEFIGVLILED